MLTDEQRAALLRDAALTNPRVFRYIWLAMHTIVRRGSLCHVTKADIDLTTGTIVLPPDQERGRDPRPPDPGLPR